MEEQEKKKEEQIWRPNEPKYILQEKYEKVALREEEEHW